MDARTRERLPVLPILVQAADQWRKDTHTLLSVARDTPPGQQLSAAGQTLVRSVRPHADPSRLESVAREHLLALAWRPRSAARTARKPILDLPCRWPWAPVWLTLWSNILDHRPPLAA
jgi:hypothetical protein